MGSQVAHNERRNVDVDVIDNSFNAPSRKLSNLSFANEEAVEGVHNREWYLDACDGFSYYVQIDFTANKLREV